MANWDRTLIGIKRREREGKIYYDPRDGRPYFVYMKGNQILGLYPIIGRDTEIIGGVYLGAGPREAILVEQGPNLEELFREVVRRSTVNGIFLKDKVLRNTYNVVKEKFTCIGEMACVEPLLKFYNVGEDDVISLERFIENGVGVCRHIALTTCAILEMLKKYGYIRGKPSVDRSETDVGAHAWCRYTNSNGEVGILDPTLGYYGYIQKAPPELKEFYLRPSDEP